MNKNNQNVLILPIILTLIFNGLMLFNNGIFIDDWKYFDQSRSDLINCFNLEGWYYTGIWAIHGFLFSFPNPLLVYHALTLCLGILSLFLINGILKKSGLVKEAIPLILIFYSVTPFFFMKNTANTFPYSLCLFLFLTAYYFTVSNFNKMKASTILLVSILFIYSFITNSLLFLYPILILQIFIQGGYNLKRLFKDHYWLFLIPIIFLLIRYTLLTPVESGSSKHYNQIIPKNLLIIPKHSILLIKNFLFYMFKSIKTHYALFMVIFIGIGAVLMSKKEYLNHSKIKLKPILILMLLGLILYIASITPYILVNKFPVFKGWETRHQLFISFGICMVLAAFILLLPNRMLRIAASSLVVAVFSTTLLFQTAEYYRGWFKYEMIAGYFEANKIETYNTLILDDDEICSNATDRDISYFEINGLYKLATDREDLYFVGRMQKNMNKEDLQKWINIRINEKLMNAYNMADFKEVDNIGRFSIKCVKNIKNNEILPFVMDYYSQGTSHIRKRYGDYIHCEVTARNGLK